MLRSASRTPSRLAQHVRCAHNQVARTPAAPHTPPQVTTLQAPNRNEVWSKSQAKRSVSVFSSLPLLLLLLDLSSILLSFFRTAGPLTLPLALLPTAHSTESMVGPRFEQTTEAYQPRPLAAIELIQDERIRMVQARVAACDGGGGALGHPRVFINLDKKGPHGCTYCGIRYEQDHHHHGHGKPAGGLDGTFSE
ncbi:hypothetical protein JCM11641_004815 [Rhodosporidiobolus odoratus]